MRSIAAAAAESDIHRDLPVLSFCFALLDSMFSFYFVDYTLPMYCRRQSAVHQIHRRRRYIIATGTTAKVLISERNLPENSPEHIQTHAHTTHTSMSRRKTPR